MRFLFVMMISATALCETPSPSAHWGALTFPNPTSYLEAGLSFDRFTPEDGHGVTYDSTITDALGFNFLSLSWNKRYPHFITTHFTMGLSLTNNEPTKLMQETLHQIFSFPTLAQFSSRNAFDFMVDGSITKWFAPFKNINLFAGLGLSAGTIYKELYVRGGVRRLPLTPAWHSGEWGELGLRASVLGRFNLQASSTIINPAAPYGHIIQPSLSFGQYKHDEDGAVVPTWEGEFALMWDSGIFANAKASAHNGFYWTAAVIVSCFRVETWNDSIGTTFISPFTDYGPTFGISLGIDLSRL